jgi:type II secretory pathway component PulF
VTTEDLIALNEEIAGMARAGLPLDQGLAALAREMGKGRLQVVTARLAADLSAGHTLPQALERQSSSLPSYYAGLVAAGVRSGRVSEVLATLTVYARSVAELRATVVSAVLYPAVVLVLACLLFGFFCFVIVPELDAVFKQMQVALPAPASLMLVISRHPLETLIVPLLVILVEVVILVLLLRFTRRGPRLWARFVYMIPILGTLLRSMRLAAFTDLLGILVDHAVPLPEAFRMAGEASTDPLMVAAAGHVQQDLKQGLPLAGVLRNRRLVPELIAWIMALGEQRGTLGNALHQVAEVYRRQVEMRVSLLRSVLPPFLIISTAGVLVGLFVLTFMMPMIRLLEGLVR